MHHKKHEALPTNPHIHIYINNINNKLGFKIKDEYKLELQTPETMKLSGSTKKLIDTTKICENIPSLEVVEAVLVPCKLVDNQYQQKSEVLYTFTPNKSYAYLLNQCFEISIILSSIILLCNLRIKMVKHEK